VLRSEKLKRLELELCRARDMAGEPADEVLRYLIDMAILEARARESSLGKQLDNLAEFPTRRHQPNPHRVG
jgi:hypothetical protein